MKANHNTIKRVVPAGISKSSAKGRRFSKNIPIKRRRLSRKTLTGNENPVGIGIRIEIGAKEDEAIMKLSPTSSAS